MALHWMKDHNSLTLDIAYLEVSYFACFGTDAAKMLECLTKNMIKLSYRLSRYSTLDIPYDSSTSYILYLILNKFIGVIRSDRHCNAGRVLSSHDHRGDESVL